MSPFISVVLPTYLEGETLRVSIESLISQQFLDFEIIIVQDGGDEITDDVVREYTDSRIVSIRQVNEGLSVARNRGLRSARGEYVCFLDADDMRPGWSLSEMAKTARASDPDCLFSRGLFVDVDGSPQPFFDDAIFDKLKATVGPLNKAFTKDRLPDNALALLYLLEPSSANKLIRTGFLRKVGLKFPPGLFFEDYFFHLRLIEESDCFSFVDMPCFTAFRRYGRPHITDYSGQARFDSLNVTRLCLEYFRRSSGNKVSEVRVAFVCSMLRHLVWSLGRVSIVYRDSYLRELIDVFDDFKDLIDVLSEESISAILDEIPPWAGDVLLCTKAYKSLRGSLLSDRCVYPEQQLAKSLFKFFRGQSHGDLLAGYHRRSEELISTLIEKKITRILVFGAGEVASSFLSVLDGLSCSIQCSTVTVSDVDTAPKFFCSRTVVSLDYALCQAAECIVVCAIHGQAEIIDRIRILARQYDCEAQILRF